MANGEWVEDVRRWYFGGSPPAADGAPEEMADDTALGYEAAQPALMARQRTDAAPPLNRKTA